MRGYALPQRANLRKTTTAVYREIKCHVGLDFTPPPTWEDDKQGSKIEGRKFKLLKLDHGIDSYWAIVSAYACLKFSIIKVFPPQKSIRF